MIQTVDDQVKAEIAIQVKNEVHKEITAFLKELELKVLKLVKPMSEEQVNKAIKNRIPEESTVEYMNFWAGINLRAFITEENEKLKKELLSQTVTKANFDTKMAQVDEKLSQMATKDDLNTMVERIITAIKTQ